MFSDCLEFIKGKCAALGVVAFFGFIPEITAEIEKKSRMHEASFPSLFVNKNFSAKGHIVTYDCLFVFRQGNDTFDNFQLLRRCLENMGALAIEDMTFNFINDASLAFTTTFKNVNLHPLTMNKLSGIEFEFKLAC